MPTTRSGRVWDNPGREPLAQLPIDLIATTQASPQTKEKAGLGRPEKLASVQKPVLSSAKIGQHHSLQRDGVSNHTPPERGLRQLRFVRQVPTQNMETESVFDIPVSPEPVSTRNVEAESVSDIPSSPEPDPTRNTETESVFDIPVSPEPDPTQIIEAESVYDKPSSPEPVSTHQMEIETVFDIPASPEPVSTHHMGVESMFEIPASPEDCLPSDRVSSESEFEDGGSQSTVVIRSMDNETSLISSRNQKNKTPNRPNRALDTIEVSASPTYHRHHVRPTLGSILDHSDEHQSDLDIPEIDMPKTDVPEINDIYSTCVFRDDELFWEAAHVFNQEQNWRDLVSEAQKLIRQATGATSRSTKSLYDNISSVRDMYEEVITSYDNEMCSRSPSQTGSVGLMRLNQRVSRVLSDISPLGVNYSRKRKLITAIHEVQYDITPMMVSLLQSCLVASYLENALSHDGVRQLTQILNDFAQLCQAVRAESHKGLVTGDSIKTMHVLVRFLAHVFQQKLVPGPPTKSESGRPTSREAQGAIKKKMKPARPPDWSGGESEMLINAMRKYRGQHRYSLILQEYDMLRHRTIEDLQQQASYLREGILALPEAKRPRRKDWDFLLDEW
ncbi:hypothetical protein FQN57_000594 [Myotisia sp. PD_48]|nr:hypothetical protein FQN57_000594 [Myotisia sp. PD_48]